MALFTIPPIYTDPSGKVWNFDGSADETAGLQQWLNNNVLDGTGPTAKNTVKALLGSQHRIEGTWYWGNGANPTITPRRYLDLDMNGAHFFATIQNPYGVEVVAGPSVATTQRLPYVKHGMDGTQPIRISGGLHYTTGLSTGVTYWPVSILADSFRLALTQGGTPIATIGRLGGDTNTDHEDKINFRNASGSTAFLFNTDFPGNLNYDRALISQEGCVGCRITSSATRGQIVGASVVSAGLSVYEPRYEAQVGVAIIGCDDWEIDNVDILTTLGDNLAVTASTTYGRANNGHVHDLSMQGAGRHNMSCGNGGVNGLLLEDYFIYGGPRHLIDIEADNPDGSGAMDDITIRDGIRRCGANTIGDIAVGGESKHVANLVIDGNVYVGTNSKNCSMGLDADFPDDQGPVRRGPLEYNDNICGGTFVLTTTKNSATATFTGYTNPSAGRWTNRQIMQFQPIKATSLPNPCQINEVSGSTLTLSKVATATASVTAVFGAQGDSPLNLGSFALLCGYDGITATGNTVTLQAGRGFAMADLDYCSNFLATIHSNNVIGGIELRHTNDFGPPPVPTIATVAPATGPTTGGTVVVLTGTNFTGATAVKFGATAATAFTVNSATKITATVPAGAAGGVDVKVTTPGGTSAAGDTFTYTAPPVPAVTGLNPNSGFVTGGVSVIIAGTRFTGATAVKFGAVSVSFVVNSDSQITALAPSAGVSTVDVTVVAPGGTSPTSAADRYSYVAVPPVNYARTRIDPVGLTDNVSSTVTPGTRTSYKRDIGTTVQQALMTTGSAGVAPDIYVDEDGVEYVDELGVNYAVSP